MPLSLTEHHAMKICAWVEAQLHGFLNLNLIRMRCSTALSDCFAPRIIAPPSPVHINPLNSELNPICHLLALLEAHHIFHVSRIRVKCGCASPKGSTEFVWKKKKHITRANNRIPIPRSSNLQPCHYTYWAISVFFPPNKWNRIFKQGRKYFFFVY